MYLDTVVIAGVLVVVATTLVVGGFIAFVFRDMKKTAKPNK